MTKFLNAAAEVFSKHGYEGSTIRAIAKKANANLGTLQHYWGSKRELFRELFELRFRPLQREHLRRLRVVEAGIANGSPPDAIEVLRSIIEPVFFTDLENPLGHGSDSLASRKKFHTLYGRALMDPSPQVINEITKMFEEPVKLFVKLMRLACPGVSHAEIDWRVNCVMGAQIFAEVYTERGRKFFGPEADVDETQAAHWMLHFLMNGINAPPFAGQSPPLEIDYDGTASRPPKRRANSRVSHAD